MRVDLKKFKLEKACSKNNMRPLLNDAYLDADNSVLVATDSYVMAVVPVDLGLEDANGLIPIEAIGLARKDQQKDDMAEIEANGRVSVRVRNERAEFDRGDSASFPDWTSLFKKAGRPVTTIVLNAKLLHQLGEAIGANGGLVKLEVLGARKPIRVSTFRGDGAKGILMPISVDDAEGQSA